MTRSRGVVFAAVLGAGVMLALVLSLPLVRWSVTLLMVWAALAVGLACHAALRLGAARWSWQVGSGLVRAGRGVVREADPSPRTARVAVAQVVRTGAVFTGDGQRLVQRCRALSPRVRAALLLVVALVAFLAASACAVVAVVWCVRHVRTAARRVSAAVARVLGGLELSMTGALERTPTPGPRGLW